SSGQASPLLMEPLDPDMKRETKIKKEKKGKGQRGRPKGSKNKNSQDAELTDYLKCLQEHILKTLKMIGTRIQIAYFVYDGAFGNNECLQMVKGCGLSLISKLQCKSALWFPYKGEQNGKGAKKKYGNKVNYSNLPAEYLVETTLKDGIEEKTYQSELLHKDFPDPLNVTIIQHRRISDDKVAQVILYSNDLELSWDNMIHYYRLRFQIEFTFRDAKQYWGLEDFMNIEETQVKNAANLSMFMVNFSRIIASQIQDANSTSMLDLKAHFQGLFYLEQVLKMDPQIQEIISFEKLQKTMANIGRIHNSQNQPIIKDKTPLTDPTQNKENGEKETKVLENEEKGTVGIEFAEITPLTDPTQNKENGEKGTVGIEFAKITEKSLRLVANCLKSITRKAS
ncbi:transposase, partial [Deltaproteobacteria bacterium TL4]